MVNMRDTPITLSVDEVMLLALSVICPPATAALAGASLKEVAYTAIGFLLGYFPGLFAACFVVFRRNYQRRLPGNSYAMIDEETGTPPTYDDETALVLREDRSDEDDKSVVTAEE